MADKRLRTMVFPGLEDTYTIPQDMNDLESIEAVAEPYDEFASYSIGDYCSNGGKFYRCNTAILSGETWNANHWTETNVGDEILAGKAATSTALSGKVSKAGDTMTGSLTVQSPFDSTQTAPSSTVNGKYVGLYDQNNKLIGYIQPQLVGTSGLYNMIIAASRTLGGSARTNNLILRVAADGSKSVSVSDPDAWRAALETIKYVNIAGTDTASGASDYAGAIKTILTSVAPQAWAKGSYAGTFQKTNSGTQTAWSGQYILNVAYSGSNHGTQGSVAMQGRIFNVWYQNGAWAVNPVNNDSGNNYCKMPDGTLIQWGVKSYSGTIAAGGQATDTVTFPTSFVNSGYSLTCNMITSVPSQKTASLSTRSVSSATISLQNTFSSASEGATYSWIAIGRWK